EPRTDRWLRLAVGLRHSLDYLRYLEPEYAHAEPLRARARGRAPVFVRMLARTWPFRSARGRARLVGPLRRMEAAIPVPESIRAIVRDNAPDAVLVAPLIGLGSIETDYLRAGQQAGIPTVLPVASWDNLTNKGVLHAVP